MTANPLNIQLSPAAGTSSGSRQNAMCGSLAVPPSQRSSTNRRPPSDHKAAETRVGLRSVGLCELKGITEKKLLMEIVLVQTQPRTGQGFYTRPLLSST
jgi:hypothetical protein